MFFFILDNIGGGNSVVFGRIGSFGISLVLISMGNNPESNRINNNYDSITKYTAKLNDTYILYIKTYTHMHIYTLHFDNVYVPESILCINPGYPIMYYKSNF